MYENKLLNVCRVHTLHILHSPNKFKFKCIKYMYYSSVTLKYIDQIKRYTHQ